MTVLDFYNQYRRLYVDLVTGFRLYNIDVHEYRNAHDYFQGGNEISADHDVDAGMDQAWAPLRQKIRREGRSLGTGRYQVTFSYTNATEVATTTLGADGRPVITMPAIHFVTETIDTRELAPAFYGKGSPSAIRKALRYAVAFGLVQPTASALNTYCQDYIGLDCSGFVGNYLQQEGNSAFGPETGATNFAPAASRISSMDQIREKSVIVWKNTNHVAIVHSVEPICRVDGKVFAMVAESCGSSLTPGDVHTDGLNYTQYEFQSVNASTKVFSVKRGIGGSTPNQVYVANLL